MRPRTHLTAETRFRRFVYGLPKSWFAAVSLLVMAAFPGLSREAIHPTALDRYVHAPDSHYHFELTRRVPRNGYTAFILDMTSQQWRSPQEVNRTLWKHWLTLYKPDGAIGPTALLFITGGNNDGKAPKLSADLAAIATTTKTVVAELRMVPNQPLTFTGDAYGPRKEDEIIAYTWDRYLKTGDSTWPLRLPMTKAAVRAMDATTSFLAGKEGGGPRITQFVVSGASKRGWTTWATAAVDPRVIAIAPIVIDVPNVVKSFQHHYRVYGFWAPAVKDYFYMGLMDAMSSPRYGELMKIEDPYSYRDRYTMPKFLINSAGDQFFLPDSSRFYFDDLPGEKYLRYIPNSDHSLKGTDAFESLAAFYQSIVAGSARPKFTWKFEHDGSIRVESETAPLDVTLWQATNPQHRDFRLESVGPIYQSSKLPPTQHGVYIARVPKPPKGWTAFFVELTYPRAGKYPFKFTTAVRIVPDTLPYPAPRAGHTTMGPAPPKAQD